MLALKTLGAIDLRDGAGAPLDGLLRQPKRVALLVYLALAEPAGYHRRDTLLALFWPDLDEPHARAALRKSLHVLRGAVGPDVIQTRGDDEVRVDPSRIDCDALAFAAVLEAGRPGEALERYRGDLRAGFFVGDASPEWEQWLDRRRAGLRRQAVEAARSHASALAETGDAAEAIRWARWAAALAPDDEQGVRHLLELLDRLGDRAGAVKAYEAFRARLEAEYEVEPAPETQALMAAIAERSAPSAPVPSAVLADPLPGAEPSASRSRPPAHRWAWRWRWALAAIPLAAAIPVVLAVRRAGLAPPLQPNLVAVAPFTVLSHDLEVWREGMVDLLARNLDGAGTLRTVSPSRMLRLWEGERGSRTDVDGASRVGRRAGVGLVVFGNLLATGADSVRLGATVVDVTTGRALGDLEIRGATARMDVVVDSLTRGLLRMIGGVRRIGSAPHTGVGSRSVPALKAFLKGEQFRRQTAWDSAQAHFEEAVSLDSTFALAWLRLGETLAMTRAPVPLRSGKRVEDPFELIHRAGKVNQGLSPHDSLMVAVSAGVAAFVVREVEGDARETAARVYQTALRMARLYPDDPEAWYMVGVVQDFLGGLVHTTFAQTWASYSRAIALDSGLAPVYRVALRISGDAGDVEGTRRLAERYLTLNPPASSRVIPETIARLLHRRTDSTAARRIIDSVPTEALWGILLAIWVLPDSNEVGLAIAREMARRPYDPRYWYTDERIVRRNLAAVLGYRGHFRESLALATTERSSWFANLPAELAVWGGVPPAVADSVFADWLVRYPDSTATPSAVWWWAARGDTAALLRFRAHQSDADEWEDGFLALGRRDTVEAVRQLTAWLRPGRYDWHTQMALVRLLVAKGDVKGALAILSGREPNDWPIPSRVVWTLERARLAELAGDRDRAAADYRFVADAWRPADPALQPFVVESREALRRLARERPIEDGPVRARLGTPRGRSE